ncbi:hypothetical protein A8924_2694 [Saccharopolyspora erythraea NRRL 2338]|uniref:Uncharacterized protein n=1 Tax=Saccharopolyspora erythraea TaxID=1836 RepID=A0ABP3N9P3_SACER|nr:hypothetical protein [Saccharopolyspora erythraea]EQD84654.1 hypothetical protein N599_18980 [Saccharopolyspora erythraea D]PFG95373.1 hypothetical protein A8924_2694 [Saccharopolyspora erythraea NRRL 2338]QRK92014.1 hypothetical protein JQX30_12025 [Saccharopolyspora erythraea]
MAEGARTYRLEVLAGGDPLREERWTRSLRDDLVQVDGIAVDFVRDAPSAPGSKGGALADLALAVAAVASSKPLAGVLTTAINEWCSRERHRKVRITRGDAELEITGNPTADQQQLVREFMEKFEDDA